MYNINVLLIGTLLMHQLISDNRISGVVIFGKLREGNFCRALYHSIGKCFALQDCLRPEGAKVGWIQCDKCEKWYHLECVSLSNKEAEQIEDYTCPVCINTTWPARDQHVTSTWPLYQLLPHPTWPIVCWTALKRFENDLEGHYKLFSV